MRKLLKSLLFVGLLIIGLGFYQQIENYRNHRYVDLIDLSEVVETSIPEGYDVDRKQVEIAYRQGLHNYFKTFNETFTYDDPYVEAFLPSYEELTVWLTNPRFDWISPWLMLGLGLLSWIVIRTLGPKDSMLVCLGCTCLFFLLGQGRHWYFYTHPLNGYDYLKAAITYRMSVYLVAMNGYIFLDIILALWMVMKKGEASDE